jgi:AcrR family transcriptional regulator
MKKNKRLIEDPKLIEKRLPQIIDAAVEQFGKSGFHATTIRDVAERAGVSIGMIYQYVEDKDDLLYLSVKRFTASYHAQIDLELEGVADPKDRFLAAVGAIAHVIDRGKAAAMMAYRESKLLSRDRLTEIMQAERDVAKRIAVCARDCVEAGVFNPVDTDMLVYQCIVLAHNWAPSVWRFRQRMTVDQYMARGLKVLLEPVLAAVPQGIVIRPAPGLPGRRGEPHAGSPGLTRRARQN